jgi:prepilin peptidase CpaA
MLYELLPRMFAPPSAMAHGFVAILSVLLLAAAWSDLRRQCIPNRLVFTGALLALLMHTLLPAGDGFLSLLPGGLGFAGSLKGLVFGLLAFLPLYALRAMGAGDVKLFAMVGAFLGPVEVWSAFFFTLLAGGILALGVALHRALLGSVLSNLKYMFSTFIFSIRGVNHSKDELLPDGSAVSVASLPYGVAIAAGSIVSLTYRAGLSEFF